MLWLFLDLVIALLALAGLVLTALHLWRRVKALGRQVSAASETVGTASDALGTVQAAGPPRRG